MSLNLHCNHLEMWQTPTFITNMCLLHDDPILSIKAYKIWVKHQLDRVWDDQEEHNYMKELVKDHCKAIDNIINNPPNDLKVYYL